jgi:membrane protease YdiL (CAAX protease family)
MDEMTVPSNASKVNILFRTILYVLWGLVTVWGVIYANNTIYQVLSKQPRNIFANDILSDAVLLFMGFLPVIWSPRFFGFQLGNIKKYWKMLLGMTIFFVGAPLIYRLLLGETPFGANTWFFEGVVVPLAEESFFRGVLLSMLLWVFGKMYSPRTTETLTIILSTLIYASAHLNNLGHYPAGFILFQVGFSTIVGLAFGYSRVKTGSIYPAIILHALFNLAGTL